MIRSDVRLGAKSIAGHRHQVEGRENEDAVLVTGDHPYFDALMLLADGMGGHPEPRLAAETAVGAARDFLFRPDRLDELAERRVDAAALVRQAVEHSNRQVRRLVARVPAGSGAEKPPGCTLSIAAIADGRLVVAHVGDGSVFLLRDGALRSLAGGEERRLGSRPEEFLGRDDRVSIEAVGDAARPGDRLLLCSDGLTRYFGNGAALSRVGSTPSRLPVTAGLERLQQVVARLSADPQALASQLTADGRGEQYEDDTTVIVADVGASREAPDLQPRRSATLGASAAADRTPAGPAERSERRDAGIWPVIAGILLLSLPAVGFLAWRAGRGTGGSPAPPFHPYSLPAVDSTGLPSGAVLLVHPESGRLFVLRTRPTGTPLADTPLALRELRFKPGRGVVVDTDRSYRLDTARSRLSAPNGRAYPVTVDSSTGLVELQQAGSVRVESEPAGLPVLIDGLAAGIAPVSVRVRAGRHQIQLLGHGGARPPVLFDFPVDVPARASLTFHLTAPRPGRDR